jgi:positive regulator of sigma E activity
MIERGTIVELKGGKAVIEIVTPGLCGYCRACTCVEKGRMRAEVDVPPGISAGDRVEIDVPIRWTRLIVSRYVLPFSAMVLGLLAGDWVTPVYFPDIHFPGLPGIVLALALVILTYLGTYLYDRMQPLEPTPLIVRKADAPGEVGGEEPHR